MLNSARANRFALGSVIVIVIIISLVSLSDRPDEARTESTLPHDAESAAPVDRDTTLAPIAGLARGHIVEDVAIPESSASEPTGNFRTICEFSHLAYDDPIVHPGAPGASHLHMFFGNDEADASSTYESLRRSGGSTCQGGPLNRSGYWAPAVHNGDGRVVVPAVISVYYKGTGEVADIASTAELPQGLRMIAGYDMDTGDGADSFAWYCEITQDKGQTIPRCPDGELVGVNLPFPSCWNGRDLDAPDHRSHVVDKVRDAHSGIVSCPETHPVHLPEFTLGVWFEHEGDSDEWYLSSDRIPGAAEFPNGSTFHSDWFGAWDPDVQTTWLNHCIREMRNCIDGELGDGSMLSSVPDYSGPHRIDAADRP